MGGEAVHIYSHNPLQLKTPKSFYPYSALFPGHTAAQQCIRTWEYHRFFVFFFFYSLIYFYFYFFIYMTYIPAVYCLSLVRLHTQTAHREDLTADIYYHYSEWKSASTHSHGSLLLTVGVAATGNIKEKMRRKKKCINNNNINNTFSLALV